MFVLPLKQAELRDLERLLAVSYTHLDVYKRQIQKPVSKQKKAINFEDIYHYPYMLTTDKFLLINDQEKMDKVYSIIHKKSGGGRMAPIPTVTENDSYLVFKAELKNSNDVEVKEIFLSDETLYVVLKDYYNPVSYTHLDVYKRQVQSFLS